MGHWGVKSYENDSAADHDDQAAVLGALRAALAATHGDRMATLMPAVSFLVDGLSCRGDDVELPDDATVDVLPPFAGG